MIENDDLSAARVISPAAASTQEEALERATQWLLAKEVRRSGDWSLMNPGLEPGGWFFEYPNGPSLSMITSGAVADLTDVVAAVKGDVWAPLLQRLTYDGKVWSMLGIPVLVRQS